MDMQAGGPDAAPLSGAAGSYLRQLASALPGAINRDALLIAIILVYWICGMVAAHVAGIPPGATITTYLSTYVPMTAAMIGSLIIGRGALIMIYDRPKRPLLQLVQEVRTTLATPQRVAHALPMVAGMLLFGGTFTVMKTTIPFFAPFSWDATFEQWDRWLHGGVAPWQWLQPVLGWPVVTRALDWLYDLWFAILSLMWAWQAFSMRDDRLRKQFFFTVLLGWILLGNVAAMLLSAAGPCFYGRITGLPDPYDALILYLRGIDPVQPVFSVTAQDILWHAYRFRSMTIGAGISAMPSMHVALVSLFALVCWRIRRWLGIAMTIYAAIVMITSVHLAWHYAVDGYIGAAGMIAIWWLVGRALAWCDGAQQPAVMADAPDR